MVEIHTLVFFFQVSSTPKVGLQLTTLRSSLLPYRLSPPPRPRALDFQWDLLFQFVFILYGW